MQQQELIEKWLNGSLTAQEQSDFEQTEDYRKLMRLSNTLQLFKAPAYDVNQEFNHLQQTKHLKKEAKIVSMSWMKPLLRIAAVLIVMAGAYFVFLSDNTTSVKTLASQQQEVLLPDGSMATANAGTSITYSSEDWKEKRSVLLEGEAFFKVAKGSKFDVITSSGTVTVLGTQFNVKVRKDYFEVVCYEGKVQVVAGDKVAKLLPGDKASIVQGTWSTTDLNVGELPDWMLHESSFQSVPYSEVLDEFERQYDIQITTDNIDVNQLFTGRFVHTNRESALQAITIPLNLKYKVSQDQKNVILSGEAN